MWNQQKSTWNQQKSMCHRLLKQDPASEGIAQNAAVASGAAQPGIGAQTGHVRLSAPIPTVVQSHPHPQPVVAGAGLATTSTADTLPQARLAQPVMQPIVNQPTLQQAVDIVSEEFGEPTEEYVEPTDEYVEPTEECVEPTEECVEPTEEHVEPSKEHVPQTVETQDPASDGDYDVGSPGSDFIPGSESESDCGSEVIPLQNKSGKIVSTEADNMYSDEETSDSDYFEDSDSDGENFTNVIKDTENTRIYIKSVTKSTTTVLGKAKKHDRVYNSHHYCRVANLYGFSRIRTENNTKYGNTN